MKRLVSIDYIRAFSILGVVLCHFCFNWESITGTGRWLGCTFNVVFVCVSALLLGKSWADKGFPVYKLDFAKHRFYRIVVAYYPFLIAMFLFLWITGYSFRIYDVVMHFAFLPWLDKLPGFGHLWFVTMIVLCYLAILLQSRWHRLTTCQEIMAVAVAGILHCCCLDKGLPGQAFSYLAVFLVTFNHSSQILDKVRSLNKVTFFYVTGILLFVVSWKAFDLGLYDHYRFVAEWVGIIDAAMAIALMLKIFDNAPHSRYIDYTSKISFEIYLIHHIVAFGRFSVLHISSNPLLALLFLLTFSYFGGFILNIISEKIRAAITC